MVKSIHANNRTIVSKSIVFGAISGLVAGVVMASIIMMSAIYYGEHTSIKIK